MDCTVRVAKSKALISCAVNSAADLRLSFRRCKKPVFSQRGSFFLSCHYRTEQKIYVLHSGQNNSNNSKNILTRLSFEPKFALSVMLDMAPLPKHSNHLAFLFKRCISVTRS